MDYRHITINFDLPKHISLSSVRDEFFLLPSRFKMADKSSEAMNVRFLINTKTQRILYAEAGKEFVDFLFSFLSMPIGSALELLYPSTSARRVGSVSNLYDSIKKLPPQLMSTDKSQLLSPKFLSTDKSQLFSPKFMSTDKSQRLSPKFLIRDKYQRLISPKFVSSDKSQLLSPKLLTTQSNNSVGNEGGKYYACSNLSENTTHNISYSSGGRCICGRTMEWEVEVRQKTNVKQSSGNSTPTAGQGQNGYVKEMATFIITDDLKITGSSTITSITLLNQLNIKDLTDLKECNAIVDRNKALGILEASFVSTTVLNDVFGAEFSVSVKSKKRKNTTIS